MKKIEGVLVGLKYFVVLVVWVLDIICWVFCLVVRSVWIFFLFEEFILIMLYVVFSYDIVFIILEILRLFGIERDMFVLYLN